MQERYITTNGLRLWTIDEGTGYPLILCNGGPGCCDYLQPIADLLTDVVRVIRFEPAGCGRSQPIRHSSVESSISDIEAVRTAYGLDRCLIGGHSWGADLALIYALTYPERVTGLIGLAGGRMNNDREWRAAYDRNRLEIGERLPDFAYPVNHEVNTQVNQSFKRYIQRPTLFRELADLTVPVLFVYGGRDIRPSWPVEQIAALLPKGHFVQLQDAEHCLWLTHNEALKRVIRPFLAEVLKEQGSH